MQPETLSRQLRTAHTPDLSRRRRIIGLSMVGAAAGAIVTLYQTGIVKHLPDPPLSIFDSDKVDASTYAYKRGNAPDAPAMLVTYGLTAWLASAGGKDRAQRHPWLPVALAAKTIFDAGSALKLAQEEWSTNQKLCAYCQAATVASVASVALALPEAAKGLRRLLGR
jgi:hypothetical protein